VADRVLPQQMNYGKNHDPQTNNRRSNSKDNLSYPAYVRMLGTATPDAETLPTEPSN
jgi:hypothetical protein